MNERPNLLKPVGPESLANEGDFRLGDIAVRPSLLEVRAGDVRETLEPRVMQVLVALAGANGMVVSRDELIRECWGGRIVGEDAINRCVARIRRLADLSGRKAFEIETIPRVGYRLLASPLGDTPPSTPPKALALPGDATLGGTAERAASRPAPAWRKIAMPAGVAALIMAVVLLAGFLAAGRNHSQPPTHTAQIAAVLPFTPLDSDAHARAFADEISADVADTLGRTEFSMISPAQSFQFRGDAKARAARALHADILVDGDVKRAGENLVVAVRVEDVASGLVLLSKEIRRPASEAADLPDQVATFVADAVGSDVTIGALNSGGNPQVRGEILRALFQCPYRQDPLCTYEIGQNLVRTAPDNAIAQTTLAIATTNVLDLLPEREKPAAIATARKAAWTAIRLDPHFGDPYIALGVLASSMAATEAYLRRGLSISPDSPSLAGYMSGFLIGTGRSQEAFTVIQKIAARYDFLQFVPLTQIWALLQLGEADDALEIARHGHKLWPDRGQFVLMQFETAVLEHDVAAAEALLNDPVIGPNLGKPANKGIVQALRTRSAADIESVSRACAHVDAGHWPHQQLCMIALVILGRIDDAFRLPLDPALDMTLFFPQLAPLRADPRFLQLARNHGLLAYWKTTHTRPDFCATEHVPVCQALALKGT
ncbi:MAG TPA: winged helix-turn-helix domain-containing protein [Rhizomicrobium sp.]|jgi:DNA-binding winged helix-turn-helix (wHTH) protein/TolB-like protein|nr:winged helix-turn-helix domain-containing protein [Rhizomicrobium sp.]